VEQLPLPMQLAPEANLDSFIAGPNAEALAACTGWADGEGEPFALVCGFPGTGKTHLLQAACQAALAAGHPAQYLPLRLAGLTPEVLSGLEGVGRIALDDCDAVAGDAAWEWALFTLYNRLRDSGGGLLASAGQPAAALPFALPDLRSRLGWGPCYRLQPLGEADCERLLCSAAGRRGLRLGPDLVDYLMRRLSRDPGSLLAFLAALDQASLAACRAPSIPLARQVLQDLSGAGRLDPR
jgi:DnaA-homolog protein